MIKYFTSAEEISLTSTASCAIIVGMNETRRNPAGRKNRTSDENSCVDISLFVCVIRYRRENEMTTRTTKTQTHKIVIRDRATGILIGSGMIKARDAGKAVVKALELWAGNKVVSSLTITTEASN